MNVVRAACALLPDGVATDVAVELSGSTIVGVRRATTTDPPALDGLLIPGLVNAHLHLELSNLRGRVPASQLGFPEWGSRLAVVPRAAERAEAATSAAAELRSSGTALAMDVTNAGDTAAWLSDVGISGIATTELLGFGAEIWPARAARAGALDDLVGDVAVRPGAHAIYSTAPGLLAAALASRVRGDRAVPSTVHIAEDPAEQAFLSGDGPWPGLLDGLKIDWRWWRPPGGTPVEYLASLGLIRPDVLLVHGVWLSASDRATIARAGAPLVVCPRSNLHIGGRLADVPALLADGVRLALGTDSLASSASLDVLDEIPVLGAAFPDVDATVWLRLATAGGASALGAPRHGRIAVGAAPGLVLLEGARAPRDLVEGPVSRRWIVGQGPLWGGA